MDLNSKILCKLTGSFLNKREEKLNEYSNLYIMVDLMVEDKALFGKISTYTEIVLYII